MGSTTTWTVTAPGVNKAQAAVLVLEFWTAKGFQEHQSSHNRLILRRNGYGTLKALMESVTSAEKKGWCDLSPVQMTALIQNRPDHAKYEIRFELGVGWRDPILDFHGYTKALVDEFIGFVNEWTRHANRAIEG
jgi:hypothetical protein